MSAQLRQKIAVGTGKRAALDAFKVEMFTARLFGVGISCSVGSIFLHRALGVQLFKVSVNRGCTDGGTAFFQHIRYILCGEMGVGVVFKKL